VGARQTERIESSCSYDQRVRGVEASGNADDDTLAVGGLQAPAQALHLDVECLVTIAVQPRRIVRHIGKAVYGALEPHIAHMRPMFERDTAAAAFRVAERGRRGAIGRRAHALEPKAFDVDIRHRHLTVRWKTIGLREQRSELVYRGLSVPRQ